MKQAEKYTPLGIALTWGPLGYRSPVVEGHVLGSRIPCQCGCWCGWRGRRPGPSPGVLRVARPPAGCGRAGVVESSAASAICPRRPGAIYDFRLKRVVHHALVLLADCGQASDRLNHCHDRNPGIKDQLSYLLKD